MKVLVLMVCILAPLGFAQSKTPAYTPPRLADGKPDLNGIWEVRSKIGQDIASAIVDPADGKVPYKKEALVQLRDNGKERAGRDPLNKCKMPGVPRLMYIPYPFQIVQSTNQPVIAILSQYVHIVRNINMKGEHLDGLDLWLGDSRGRWEGDALVVDVTNFNDQTWLDAAGNYHSDALHVVERFTRTGPDVITYEATITDPTVLTKPFKIRMPLARHTEKNFQLLEYECYAVKEGPTVTVGDKPDPEHSK
ncbi:MAG: hypothetical protein ABSG41_11905 [Bryobacteraceae bacterium]|jgi:hypothetical protein